MISIAAFPKCWLEDIVEGRMDLFDWIEQSVRLGCEGLEMYAGFLASRESAYLKKIRERVEALGMCIPMMCYSPDFTVADRAFRRREIEKQIEIIETTADLGGGFCRVLSGQARPEVEREAGVLWVVECIQACLPAAERCGVTLVMENHFKDGYWTYPEFAQKMDVFLDIIRRIDSPCFGVQYDPSNAIVAGDDPIELLEAVLPRVRTMHASDRCMVDGVLKHGVVGRGLNDYDAIFERLAGAGYRGWVSIEDGMNGMAEMQESADFLRSMREKYFA